MVSLRVPVQRLRVTRQTPPVRRAMRGVETALYDLPVVNRFTKRSSLQRRVARPLDRMSKTQRGAALVLVAGTAITAITAGVIIGYRARRAVAREDARDRAEETLEEVVQEAIIEEFEHTVLTE